MSLRPRQIQAVDDVSAAYRSGFKAPILVASTGFGKTHTSATIIRRALAKGKKVWFLAHLREILDATSKKLIQEQIPHGWIAAGMLGDRRQAVQVCMVQTLVRRLERYEPPDLIIIDECHLAVAETYQKITRWANSSWLLGLTATPARLDGRGLEELFDVIVPTCSMQNLIDEGLLVPIRYFAPGAPDLSAVRTTAGDFNQADLANAMDRPKITGSAVAEYRKVASGRPTIVFCVSIDHARHVADEFKSAGFRSVAISGDSDRVEREAALRGLQNGSLDVVCNCALWIAGVDAPAVSCVILLAPTKSLTKYLQSVGRGMRTCEGKRDLIVLDHAGCVQQFGLPTMDREWTLDGAVKKRKRKESEMPVKTCGKCFATMPSAVTHCACGFVFPVISRQIEEVEGELQEVDMAQVIRERKREQARAQTFEDLVAIGRARGMKRPELWSKFVLRARAAKQASRVQA